MASHPMLVAFYVLWFVETFRMTLIAPMLVRVTDFGLAMRWIRKEGLPCFAVVAGYDKVPLKGYALG